MGRVGRAVMVRHHLVKRRRRVVIRAKARAPLRVVLAVVFAFLLGGGVGEGFGSDSAKCVRSEAPDCCVCVVQRTKEARQGSRRICGGPHNVIEGSEPNLYVWAAEAGQGGLLAYASDIPQNVESSAAGLDAVSASEYRREHWNGILGVGPQRLEGDAGRFSAADVASFSMGEPVSDLAGSVSLREEAQLRCMRFIAEPSCEVGYCPLSHVPYGLLHVRLLQDEPGHVVVLPDPGAQRAPMVDRFSVPCHHKRQGREGQRQGETVKEAAPLWHSANLTRVAGGWKAKRRAALGRFREEGAWL